QGDGAGEVGRAESVRVQAAADGRVGGGGGRGGENGEVHQGVGTEVVGGVVRHVGVDAVIAQVDAQAAVGVNRVSLDTVVDGTGVAAEDADPGTGVARDGVTADYRVAALDEHAAVDVAQRVQAGRIGADVVAGDCRVIPA